MTIHDNPPYFYIMSGFPHRFSASFHQGSGVGWPFSNQCSSNHPWGGSGRSSRITMQHPWISRNKKIIMRENYRIRISFSPINIIYICEILARLLFSKALISVRIPANSKCTKSWTLEPRDLKPLRPQLVELFNTIQLHHYMCSLSAFLQTSGIHISSQRDFYDG